VDPGLASVGWGVIESAGGRLVHLGHGCINTASGDEMSARLLSIYDELSALIEEWKPNWASMESLFFWRNVTSAIPVSEAKGVIRLAFVKSGVPLVEYSPTAIKQAVVGTSRAEKEQGPGDGPYPPRPLRHPQAQPRRRRPRRGHLPLEPVWSPRRPSRHGKENQTTEALRKNEEKKEEHQGKPKPFSFFPFTFSLSSLLFSSLLCAYRSLRSLSFALWPNSFLFKAQTLISSYFLVPSPSFSAWSRVAAQSVSGWTWPNFSPEPE